MPQWNPRSGDVQHYPPGAKRFPSFNENYVEWYDTRRGVRRVSRRQRSDGGADLLDVMDMIQILMEQHQMSFIKDKDYGFRLFFPYMFVKPKVGDQLRNMTTGEVYSIVWVEDLEPNQRRAKAGPLVGNPDPDNFTGLIIISGTTAPSWIDRLEFVNKDGKIIDFFEWGSRRHSNVPTGDGEGDVGQGQTGPFAPTITWSVNRVEPGTIGRRPFDPAKMSKPMFRESYPDPQYTYLLDSQMYEESVKQQSIYPTGDPMFTGSYGALTRAQMDPRVSTHNLEVYGQWFDNLVQFDCWSPSNQVANALIAWFEDFMELYTPTMKQNGVAEMLYWERLQDQTIERWRNDIDNRTIRWYFRTEKLRVSRQRLFRRFTFRLSLGQPNEELRVYSEPTGIGTWTGMYGLHPSQLRYDSATGATGHFTGDNSYLWGQLTIEET